MYAVGADIARFYRWAWTGEKQPKIGEGRFARIRLSMSLPDPVEEASLEGQQKTPAIPC